MVSLLAHVNSKQEKEMSFYLKNPPTLLISLKTFIGKNLYFLYTKGQNLGLISKNLSLFILGTQSSLSGCQYHSVITIQQNGSNSLSETHMYILDVENHD